MAILTTPRGFRYPALTGVDTPDVPRDIKALADDVDTQYLAVANAAALPAFGKPGRRILTVDRNVLYLDTGTAWIVPELDPLPTYAKVLIPTEQTRTSTSFGVLTTPDQVSVTVPDNDSLIDVSYMAQWKGPGVEAGIFLGSDQVRIQASNNVGNCFPVSEAAAYTSTFYSALMSSGFGLFSIGSQSSDSTPDVATGQIVGAVAMGDTDGQISLGGAISSAVSMRSGAATGDGYAWGGPCRIYIAAAGTYTVSIRFRATIGGNTVSVKNRRLWAKVIR